MDKDVEVSKDKNTIVVDGVRYTAAPIPSGAGSACDYCHVKEAEHKHKFCSLIPCTWKERPDLIGVIYLEIR